MRKSLLLLGITALLAACSGVKVEQDAPDEAKIQRLEGRGKLTGEDGLIVAGGDKDETASAGSAINVNSFLWRASLDTLSFMPLASADPFGGVIITDWYEDPKTPGERFKINVLILDKTLRADGVKITVFKQSKEKGGWADKKVDDKLARTLEDTILTRARQLRVNQGK